MKNIRTELTAEQTGLVIHAIDQFIARSAITLTPEQVSELGRVANNLSIHLNFAEAEHNEIINSN